MAKIIEINDPKQLPSIIGVIHDCWFDVDCILFDSSTKIFSIKFMKELHEKKQVLKNYFLFKKVIIPSVECILTIHNVIKYCIDDKLHVGKYDFNELIYQPTLNRIKISTGVPLNLEVDIIAFQISVEETNRVLEENKTFSF